MPPHSVVFFLKIFAFYGQKQPPVPALLYKPDPDDEDAPAFDGYAREDMSATPLPLEDGAVQLPPWKNELPPLGCCASRP